MTKGFWRGIIVGGLMGGILSNLFGTPSKKMEGKDSRADGLRVQAQRVMNEAKDGVKGLYRKK